MSDPLKRQVGGNHYQSKGVQHVQFCQVNRIPWAESCALKYLTRHRRKNGLQDVEKARHYVEFVVALDYDKEGKPLYSHAQMVPERLKPSLQQFMDDNGVPDNEQDLMRATISHQVRGNRDGLLKVIDRLKEIEADYEGYCLL